MTEEADMIRKTFCEIPPGPPSDYVKNLNHRDHSHLHNNGRTARIYA